MVCLGLKCFLRHETLHAKTREGAGKPGQVDHPIFYQVLIRIRALTQVLLVLRFYVLGYRNKLKIYHYLIDLHLSSQIPWKADTDTDSYVGNLKGNALITPVGSVVLVNTYFFPWGGIGGKP